jgi:nucleoside-diphosphate-sugar epimerase
MLAKSSPGKPHVVVTGGAGFIGSHLCTRLLETGSRVTILTRHIGTARARQLAEAGAAIVACDLASAAGVPAATTAEIGSVDVFYHLAADVAVSSPTLEAANIDGTRHALALAAAAGADTVVVASSIEAQGPAPADAAPLAETAPCEPVSDYGASKQRAETVATEWGAAHGRPPLVLRIGNVYGPGSPWMLQPSLLALLGATPLGHVWPQLHGRVFQPLYLDDCVEGMVRAVGEGLAGTYNLTGSTPVTLAAYVQQLASLAGLLPQYEALRDTRLAGTGIAPDFAYLLMGPPARTHRAYDDTLLRSAIGDYARWSLARGLAATLAWYHESGALTALLGAVQRHVEEVACTSH